MCMHRVPTWTKSPYLGMFQYRAAGPEHIHKKAVVPFLLPSSPYLGWFRHDLTFAFRVPDVVRQSKSTQTDVCLSAFVIDDYR